MLAPAMHRLNQSDLTQEIAWVLKRLVEKYPNRNEIGWANYLRSTCSRNDCLFLIAGHVVAMAEVVQVSGLDNKKVVYERFVWCENRVSRSQVEQAAELYDEFHKWAASQGIEEIEVAKDTDVPLEMITQRLGRLHVTQIRRAKV